MKIILKKEFDGQVYVASCENVPGCYTQSSSEEEVRLKVQRALAILKTNCQEHNQPFPVGQDHPIINMRLRFNKISTDQLVRILQQHHYHLEYINEESVLLANTVFPFNRIHLPRSTNLSPLLVKKIFGEKNTIFIQGSTPLKYRKSAL